MAARGLWWRSGRACVRMGASAALADAAAAAALFLAASASSAARCSRRSCSRCMRTSRAASHSRRLRVSSSSAAAARASKTECANGPANVRACGSGQRRTMDDSGIGGIGGSSGRPRGLGTACSNGGFAAAFAVRLLAGSARCGSEHSCTCKTRSIQLRCSVRAKLRSPMDCSRLCVTVRSCCGLGPAFLWCACGRGLREARSLAVRIQVRSKNNSMKQ